MRKLRQDLTVVRSETAEQRKHQLDYAVDKNTQSVVEKVIDNRLKTVLYNNLWRRVFRWYEPWDSIDNWSIFGTNTRLGDPPFMGALIVETDAIAADQAYAARLLTNFNVVNSFDFDSSFRVSFYFKLGPDNAVYYLTVGDHLIDARNFYGFKIIDGEIYGVISNGGVAAEIITTKSLGTVTNIDVTNESYLLEARYQAGVKVEFLVTINRFGIRSKMSSTVIANIPSPINTPAMLNPIDTPFIFSFSATTSDAVAKNIYLLDLDYIQRLELS